MDFLKDAIAEAKLVKKIAQQNAVETLTEAFTPQLSGIISKKLAEEDEDMEDPELEAPIEEVDDVNSEEEMEMEAPIEDEEDDLDLEEIMAELDSSGEEDEPIMEEEEEDMEVEAPIEDEMEEEPVEDELDEIIQEVEDELEDESIAPKMESIALTRKLKEAYRIIKHQSKIISEVRNLNYKLLYTTKLFGKFDLTENTKMKILEQFDRAYTEREIKLIYATICENLSKNRKKVTKKPIKTPLKESASKAIKSVSAPINTNQSNIVLDIDRMQKLAGINK